jgi:hypothetical protein
MSVTVTEAEMRVTIKTLFVTACGSPGMEERKDVGGRQGTVSKIEELLQPTLDNPWAFQKPPDRRTIESVLVRVHEAIENGEDIDVVERRVTEKGGSGGHNKIIKAGTEDADIALTCLRAGFGQRWTTTIMNASRRRRKMKELSRQAVQSAIVTMKIQCVKRTKQKTGSRDPASNWACARDVGCRQFYYQLLLGEGLSFEDALAKVNEIEIIEPEPVAPNSTSDGTDDNPDSTSAERMDEMDAELPTDWSDDALVDYLIERVSVLCWPCMLFPHTPPLFSGCCVCALRFLTLLLCSLSSRIG